MENAMRLVKERLLRMYERLSEGQTLYLKEEAALYHCSERSIKRDIGDLRAIIADLGADQGTHQELVYDRAARGYRLQPPRPTFLSNAEIYTVIKILLESRALPKSELEPVIGKLLNGCVPKGRKAEVQEMVANERHHYQELRNKRPLLELVWALSNAVREHRIVRFQYTRLDGKTVERTVHPLGVMFSEFYFYLIALIPMTEREGLQWEQGDNIAPTIYRLDRMQDCAVLDSHFYQPYQDRIEEGLFRQRVQFMQGGKLRRAKFYYKGPLLDAVFDRLPTARVLKQDEHGTLLTAETYGTGLDMWLRSQGDYVEVLEIR